MKIIVPMAGRGSRLRPHTLTVPKPLVPVGGKPIVHRLVEDIAAVCSEKIEEIGFVIGDFGADIEKELIKVADRLDRFGLHKEASTIDALIKKVSSDESEYSREPEYLNKYEDSSNWSDEDWQRYMSESPYE